MHCYSASKLQTPNSSTSHGKVLPTLIPIRSSSLDELELLVVHAEPLRLETSNSHHPPEPHENHVQARYIAPGRAILRVYLQIGGAYAHARGRHYSSVLALIDTGSGKSYMCHPMWNLGASPSKSPQNEGLYQDMAGHLIPIVGTRRNVPLCFRKSDRQSHGRLLTTHDFQLIRMSPLAHNR